MKIISAYENANKTTCYYNMENENSETKKRKHIRISKKRRTRRRHDVII